VRAKGLGDLLSTKKYTRKIQKTKKAIGKNLKGRANTRGLGEQAAQIRKGKPKNSERQFSEALRCHELQVPKKS